jgi:hypothetical protein
VKQKADFSLSQPAILAVPVVFRGTKRSPVSYGRTEVNKSAGVGRIHELGVFTHTCAEERNAARVSRLQGYAAVYTLTKMIWRRGQRRAARLPSPQPPIEPKGPPIFARILSQSGFLLKGSIAPGSS